MPFLLRDAAQDTKFLALGFELLVVRKTMEDFLLSFVPNRAGVVEHQAGFLDRRDLEITLRKQGAYDFLRIVGIHLAAEGFEVKGLLLGGHQAQV